MRILRFWIPSRIGWSAERLVATLVRSVAQAEEVVGVSVVFWAWVAIAVLLALCEAVTGGLYVIPWSLGAAIAAALEALRLPTGWQWIAFFGVSSVVLVVVQRIRRHRR
jgi:hypothetical protein